MQEAKTLQPELPVVEAAPGEKHSAVIARGISMPAHQVRAAIAQAVARGQLSEEDGEEIFWLYSYAQEYRLKEAELAAKMGVEMPISDLVYALCYENFDAAKAVEAMMSRELKSE